MNHDVFLFTFIWSFLLPLNSGQMFAMASSSLSFLQEDCLGLDMCFLPGTRKLQNLKTELVLPLVNQPMHHRSSDSLCYWEDWKQGVRMNRLRVVSPHHPSCSIYDHLPVFVRANLKIKATEEHHQVLVQKASSIIICQHKWNKKPLCWIHLVVENHHEHDNSMAFKNAAWCIFWMFSIYTCVLKFTIFSNSAYSFSSTNLYLIFTYFLFF